MNVFYILSFMLFWLWFSLIAGQNNFVSWLVIGYSIFVAIVGSIYLIHYKNHNTPVTNLVPTRNQNNSIISAIDLRLDLMRKLNTKQDSVINDRIQEIQLIIDELKTGTPYTNEMHIKLSTKLNDL